jgi:Flp pilus assembly protein TadG
VAIVEFAVVLPLMLILVVGLFEVGQLVRVRMVLDSAVREGCRQASIGQRRAMTPDPVNPINSIRDVVEGYLARSGINTEGLEVRVLGEGGGPIEPSTLNASINQPVADQFVVEVSLPFDRNGTQGNRLVDINYKIISYPRLTSRSQWYSMRDFPLLAEALDPPIE